MMWSNRKNVTNNHDQLRPVILLLAVAVILPTVCLLWFMTQAVKNERLAVRQKLVDHYRRETEDFVKGIDGRYENWVKSYQKRIDQKEPFKDTEDSDDEGKFVDVQLSRAIDVLKGIRVYAKTTGTD